MTLRPISADRVVHAVWYHDPAVDRSKSANVTDYTTAALKNPACWQEMLKFHDGQKPTVFHVGVISPGDLATIEDQCADGVQSGAHRMSWLCFINGVRDIENMDIKDIPKVSGFGGHKYVSPVWLAEQFAGPLRQCARFIGTVAYRWNQFGEEEAKNL